MLYGDTRLSYADLRRQTLAVSRLLRASGRLQPGDRVGLRLRNRPEFIPALLGALHAGAVVVPINNFLKPDEVGYLLADAGIGVLLTESALAADLDPLRPRFPDLLAIPLDDPRHDLGGTPPTTASGVNPDPDPDPDADAFPPPVPRGPTDLAVLFYTSGTTGRPKGAMLTHGNLLHNVDSCRRILEVVEFDRFVLLLPMFHSFMVTACILLPLLSGGSIVLVRSLHPPKAMLAEIMANQGTVLPAMSQVFRALAALPPEVRLPLRLCVSGAGPLPREILRAFNARFPDLPLIEGYGLSEASPVVSINPVHGPWVPGSIGLPIPNVEISIRDESGLPLPDLVDGEICVRGGNVMQGYWNAPEQTRESFRDGWLLTGDIGHRRTDGYFVITDRKKDMLKPNGLNVYPREIEEVLFQFPGIREAAVVGEPDERRGERPVAFVSVDDGTSLDERALLAFLRERLADYKLPRRAILLAALPRNATGKILKTCLREIIAGQHAPPAPADA